ncbi:ABC transporter permease [Streptomyces sp. NPDC051976]|uniref:ABC transporter permease n=1 Tax=Streptomyces sp. NPDC051976 TaxID=3154947 RepID=UPI003448D772
MAVAEPYAASGLAPSRGGKARAALRQYFQGTSVSSWIAFGALGLMFLIAIFAKLIAPHDPLVPVGTPLTGPSVSNWFGTDTVGRDVFSRVVVGMSTSWWGALAVVAWGVIFGGLIGLIAGAWGGIVDSVLMRVTDVFLALPGPILAVAVVAAMGPSYFHTLVGISIVWWPLYTRIVRAEIRKLRASPHMEAARLAGAGWWRQLSRHLLPGAVPVTIITASLDISALVLMLSSLSFLGLGAPQPAPELGAMAAQGMTNIFTSWWIPIFPAAAVSAIAIVSNFAGEALRDRIRDR